MTPIPRRVLKHTASLIRPLGKDEFRQNTPGSELVLSYIHCVSVRQSSLDALGERRDDRLILFYDCTNSAPAGIKFTTADKIKFGALTFAVRIARLVEDEQGNPHHWELTLKG